jgi:hypothetical protein
MSDRIRLGRSDEDGMAMPSGLMALAKVLVLLEAAQYSAITPLLPHFAHQFQASKASMGVLAASYPAGSIPGSFLAGAMASRLGVRATTLAGLAVFSIATTAFGFVNTLSVLDVLRATQGVACGLIWVGALTWVITLSPTSRRGTRLGSGDIDGSFRHFVRTSDRHHCCDRQHAADLHSPWLGLAALGPLDARLPRASTRSFSRCRPGDQIATQGRFPVRGR